MHGLPPRWNWIYILVGVSTAGSPARITRWHNLLCCIWKWIQNVFKLNSTSSKFIIRPTPCSFFIHKVAVVQLSQALSFVVLLWCSSCSFCNSQSWRGEALVRFVIHNVAVVQLSHVLNLAMLLWWTSCSFCYSQCCWGASPARFVIRNVAVVRLLLIFHSGQLWMSPNHTFATRKQPMAQLWMW